MSVERCSKTVYTRFGWLPCLFERAHVGQHVALKCQHGKDCKDCPAPTPKVPASTIAKAQRDLAIAIYERVKALQGVPTENWALPISRDNTVSNALAAILAVCKEREIDLKE